MAAQRRAVLDDLIHENAAAGADVLHADIHLRPGGYGRGVEGDGKQGTAACHGRSEHLRARRAGQVVRLIGRPAELAEVDDGGNAGVGEGLLKQCLVLEFPDRQLHLSRRGGVDRPGVQVDVHGPARRRAGGQGK